MLSPFCAYKELSLLDFTCLKWSCLGTQSKFIKTHWNGSVATYNTCWLRFRAALSYTGFCTGSPGAFFSKMCFGLCYTLGCVKYSLLLKTSLLALGVCGLLNAPHTVDPVVMWWWPCWQKLGSAEAGRTGINQSITLLKVKFLSIVFSYSMENFSYIAVLEVTFLSDLVMLLLYALVSLIAVKKEEYHLLTHCILDVSMCSEE